MISMNAPKGQQAAAITAGYMLVIFLGIAAIVAIVLGCLWAIAQLFLLVLQCVIECLSTIGTTYQAADPLVKFLILVAIGFLVYRAGKWFLARR